MILEREQIVRGEIDQVFRFFGDAHNLEAITPPLLRFEVLTPRPIEMRAGTLIAYRMRIHRFPVRWLTEIETWQAPARFIDRQLRGPYRLWHHTHSFEPCSGGTSMRDSVRYELPFGPIGRLAHSAFVRRDLERIFDFRAEAISRRLG